MTRDNLPRNPLIMWSIYITRGGLVRRAVSGVFRAPGMQVKFEGRNITILKFVWIPIISIGRRKNIKWKYKINIKLFEEMKNIGFLIFTIVTSNKAIDNI